MEYKYYPDLTSIKKELSELNIGISMQHNIKETIYSLLIFLVKNIIELKKEKIKP